MTCFNVHTLFTAATHLEKQASLGNSAALLAGGALLGAGIVHGVLGAKKRDEILSKLRGDRYQQVLQEWQQGFKGAAVASSAGFGAKLHGAAEDMGKPTSAFRLSMPGPAAGGQKTLNTPVSNPANPFKGPAAGAGLGGGRSIKSIGGAPAVSAISTASSAKTGSDAHTNGLLAAAGLGGLGGYAVGKHVIGPQFASVADKFTSAARNAPIGGAVAGAILLAALVALWKNRNPNPAVRYVRSQAYDPYNEGFEPQGRRYAVS